MATNATGFIGQFSEEMFLSRSGQLTDHRDYEDVRGIQLAWVHSAESLLRGLSEVGETDVTIYPASFDAEHDLTVITGEAMTFDTFLETHQSAQ